jgi:hypothetical protein
MQNLLNECNALQMPLEHIRAAWVEGLVPHRHPREGTPVAGGCWALKTILWSVEAKLLHRPGFLSKTLADVTAFKFMVNASTD